MVGILGCTMVGMYLGVSLGCTMVGMYLLLCLGCTMVGIHLPTMPPPYHTPGIPTILLARSCPCIISCSR